MLLESSQNSQENTCARYSFLLRPATLLKKSLLHRCFPVNFEKFLKTPFLPNIPGRLLPEVYFFYFIIFFIWVFFREHSRITGLQGKGEGISLTPHCHFHPLHRHLDISRAITAESSPLHIAMINGSMRYFVLEYL